MVVDQVHTNTNTTNCLNNFRKNLLLIYKTFQITQALIPTDT